MLPAPNVIPPLAASPGSIDIVGRAMLAIDFCRILRTLSDLDHRDHRADADDHAEGRQPSRILSCRTCCP